MPDQVNFGFSEIKLIKIEADSHVLYCLFVESSQLFGRTGVSDLEQQPPSMLSGIELFTVKF